MRRLVPMVIALMLVAAACGGSDDSGGSDDGGATTTTVSSDDGGSSGGSDTTTTQAGSGDDGGSTGGDVEGVGEATVEIDGQTYHFGETSFPALRCEPDMFGVFFVVLQMVDENGNEIPSGGGFELVLLGEGVDADTVGQLPTAKVSIAALEEEWYADEEDSDVFDIDPGTSQIDDYTIDGNHASGTATMYERNSYYAKVGGTADAVKVTQATFDVTCAG